LSKLMIRETANGRQAVVTFRNDLTGLAMSERPAFKSFRDLAVWQKAHHFVLAVYALTKDVSIKEDLRSNQSNVEGSCIDHG